jgi:hypothetical protein
MLGTRTFDTGNARATAVVGGLAGAKCSVLDANELTASPRTWEVGAPDRRVLAGDPYFGATESFPRAGTVVPALQGIDAVVIDLPWMEEASIAGSWGPRGTSRSQKTHRAGRAVLGRGSVKGLTRSNCIESIRQGIREGMPCHWVAIGTGRMGDDVVKTPGTHREGVAGSRLGPIVVCE